MLTLWNSKLTTFEETVWRGKAGRGREEIEGLRSLLKEMLAKAEAVSAAWLVEKVRMRTVNGQEERKDRPEQLRYILEGYQGCDGEGEVERYGQDLLAKWLKK
ncbi:hypothetical protein B0H17DRAFT_1068782 [Mycena rosella]|uniref:Uncharacterized protein n=1 Tax=Mycena rosella TaxID=1033263 RepID=A0AAD7GCW7_MYCRO|nr:hypothetical protein B0H17DRAFT_1068782 [Mycena rosella]